MTTVYGEPKTTLRPVRTYQCWVPKWEGTELGSYSSYTRYSAGQAKKAFYAMLKDLNYPVRYIDIRCRSTKSVIEDSGVISTAQYRNTPFVYTGMPARIGGLLGRIVEGGGGGAWFYLLSLAFRRRHGNLVLSSRRPCSVAQRRRL
ncbi:MAG: hypothetical protein AAF810_01475 [Cyanobacteria bacterium P01_D01_bin.36]